jgi:hypothetical protein
MGISGRLDYALSVRKEEWSVRRLSFALQAMNEDLVACGFRPLPKVRPNPLGELFSLHKDVSYPAETVEAVARLLRIRPAWVFSGEGPMEADTLADPKRELFLVDGALRHFKADLNPEDRNRARKDFFVGFKPWKQYKKVSYTVQVVFQNVLARFCQRQREKGNPEVANALWRGKAAANLWNDAVQGAQVGDDLGTGREDTDALLRALSQWERKLRD